MHLAQCTSCSTGGSILSTARPNSTFQVVAKKMVSRSVGYFLHVCGNGQRLVQRNATQIPRITKSLCIHNYTKSAWEKPESHSSKPCCNDSEVWGIEWAAPGICTGCPTGENRVPHIVPHTWLLNTWPSGYDNRASDIHQLSGVAQMRVLHGLMSRLNITMSMIYCILECRKDYTPQVIEHGGVLPSDGEDEWYISGQCNQGMPL